MPVDRLDRLTPGAFRALLALCVIALAVRVFVAAALPSIIHQDETFQYLEQAHRLVFGSGLRPWEYIVGLRSWLFPGLIAGVMEVSRLFGDSPETTRIGVAVFMSLLSLAPVVCGFLWGWRVGGLAAAVAAGALNAFWFENVYFSSHTLSETLAADSLAVGLFLAYPGVRAASARGLFLGGFFLGLTLTFRLQLGPAVALGVIAICGTAIRKRWLPLIVGGVLPFVLAGLLDWATWDWPFQSMVLNVLVNVKEGVAAEFSKSPLYQYLSLDVTYWSGAFALIVALALYGARRLPILLLVAVVVVATHSLLAHKEYRFVYPALPLIITLVGIGSAEVARRLQGGGQQVGAAMLWGVPLFWIVTSLVLARSREFYPLWYRDQGSIAAMQVVNVDPKACGVGIYPADMWDRSGGYAHLKAGVPLYGRSDADPAEAAQAFNYLIGYKPADFTALGFTKLRCWAEPPGRTISVEPTCLWSREGACTAGGAPLLTAAPPAFLLQKHPEWFDKHR